MATRAQMISVPGAGGALDGYLQAGSQVSNALSLLGQMPNQYKETRSQDIVQQALNRLGQTKTVDDYNKLNMNELTGGGGDWLTNEALGQIQNAYGAQEETARLAEVDRFMKDARTQLDPQNLQNLLLNPDGARDYARMLKNDSNMTTAEATAASQEALAQAEFQFGLDDAQKTEYEAAIADAEAREADRLKVAENEAYKTTGLSKDFIESENVIEGTQGIQDAVNSLVGDGIFDRNDATEFVDTIRRRTQDDKVPLTKELLYAFASDQNIVEDNSSWLLGKDATYDFDRTDSSTWDRMEANKTYDAWKKFHSSNDGTAQIRDILRQEKAASESNISAAGRELRKAYLEQNMGR